MRLHPFTDSGVWPWGQYSSIYIVYESYPNTLAAIQMKVIEHNTHVVLFILLCKVVLTFKYVDKNLVCVQSTI